ncbi:MAG: hypothetical protein IJG13_19445 [Kiritimatiellae bacterium]|nr:hypothetical protein [Kiritimatiellia bacterium]MBQ3344510.1 hypothetical protein [Kiritimatiellia bacterium]
MNIPALGNGLDDCGVLMTPFGIQRHLHHGEPTATTCLSPRKVFAAFVRSPLALCGAMADCIRGRNCCLA